MKTDLTDVTFLMLVRLDSVERLENTLTVTESLVRYFHTNVHVWEADSYNRGLLQKLLNRKVNCRFVEDKDPILHKTMYYNQMAATVKTPCMAIWDTDIVIDGKAITDAVTRLRNESDAVFPYNGTCYEVPGIIKRLYFMRKDMRILYRNKVKMNLLHEKILYGGAVFVKTDKYLEAGGDSEAIYGWGNDDFVRHKKWEIMNYRIGRTQNPLFHLSHPRGKNSTYGSRYSAKISAAEYSKLTNSSMKDVINKSIDYERD
jgi:hypothetical protein